MAMTSAVEMANRAGVDAKAFRYALRKEKFPWHSHNDRWTVENGSERHAAMERVLRRLQGLRGVGDGFITD
jgi:hypothetical protein